MKRITTLILCMLFLFSGAAIAVDDSRSYSFALTINGKNEIHALPGDILTVTVTLRRTDSGEAADIYAIQDEIRYNSAFLELVEGSVVMSSGVETNDISLQGDERSFYVNYVSFGGGDSWESDKVLGTFQMKVLSDSGSATLLSENYSVSLPDGSDSYAVSTQDVTIIVSKDCTVVLDPQNGEEPTVLTVSLGDTLTMPEKPIWEGHSFNGWFRDKSLAELWDFENGMVKGNMTLYGGWSDGASIETVIAEDISESEPVSATSGWIVCGVLGVPVLAGAILFVILRRKTVRFDSMGGSPVAPVKAWRGKTLRRPRNPCREGYDFAGWYMDSCCTREWKFARDRVWRDGTLYAKWEEEQR